MTLGTTYYYVVSALSGDAEGANSTQASALPSAAVSAAYLKMDEASGTTTADESGNALNGTLINGPTRTTGRLDRGISFDGSNDHVTLPSGVVSTLNDCTISAWVRPNALSTWARVFDFGTGTDNHLFFAPQGGTGKPVFSIRTPSTPGQDINSSVALTVNAWNHVAVTISGNTGTLYINGVVAGGNGTMSLKPSSLGNTTQNYLGRSQFPDPYFNGLLDEFQIRNRALTATEVAALADPPNAPVGLLATGFDHSVSLTWNAVADTTAYTVKRSTVSGGPYATVASGLSSTNYTDPGLTAGTVYYYVVIAQKFVADSANCAQASATALTASEVWRRTYFGSTSATGNAAPLADPDGDTLLNIWEYFHGTNPNVAGASPLQVQQAANRAMLTFPRCIAATDVLTRIQGADSLAGPWTDLAQSTAGTGFTPLVGGVTVNENGAGATRTVTLTGLYFSTDPAHPQRFFRLWSQQQ